MTYGEVMETLVCMQSGKSLAVRDVDISFDTTCANTACYSYTSHVTLYSIVFKMSLQDTDLNSLMLQALQ